jgi:hypothetical protein
MKAKISKQTMIWKMSEFSSGLLISGSLPPAAWHLLLACCQKRPFSTKNPHACFPSAFTKGFVEHFPKLFSSTTSHNVTIGSCLKLQSMSFQLPATSI